MNKLTKAENEVYKLILKGLSKKKIAKIRKVTIATIATQVYNIFCKLGVNSVLELMAARIKELEDELSQYN